MQAGYRCCVATALLRRGECPRELNVLIKRSPGEPLGAAAAIAFFCKQPPKLLGR